MTPASPLAVVSLLLTLSSLLGSFFYLQLSQWVRDILAVKTKTDLNRFAGVAEEKKAMRECAIEIDKLLNWPTYVVNTAAMLFVVVVILIAFRILGVASADPLYPFIWYVFSLFLFLFIFLSLLLSVYGTYQGYQVRRTVRHLRITKKLDL